MRAGRLRHKVTLERKGTTKNQFGEIVDTWTSIAVRRCSIEPLMGKEFFANDNEYSRLTTRIRIRHDSTVKTLRPYDRLVDNSESPAVIYDIESIQNPRERDIELVLMCERNGAS